MGPIGMMMVMLMRTVVAIAIVAVAIVAVGVDGGADVDALWCGTLLLRLRLELWN